MNMFDIVVGIVWLACSLFAAFRVYAIEKKRVLQAPASPSATPVHKGKKALVFILTVVMIFAMILVMGLIYNNFETTFGRDEADLVLAVGLLSLGGVLMLWAGFRKVSIVLAPAAGSVLTVGLIQLLMCVIYKTSMDTDTADVILTALMIAVGLLCAVMAVFRYQHAMQKPDQPVFSGRQRATPAQKVRAVLAIFLTIGFMGLMSSGIAPVLDAIDDLYYRGECTQGAQAILYTLFFAAWFVLGYVLYKLSGKSKLVLWAAPAAMGAVVMGDAVAIAFLNKVMNTRLTDSAIIILSGVPEMLCLLVAAQRYLQVVKNEAAAK